jgi:hypothetical protein
MSSKNEFNIMIASSEDIVIERKIVQEICWGLNKGILPNHHSVSFQIKDWDKIFTSAGTSREIISGLAEECDILILIFHKKFGVPSESLVQFLSSYDQWESLKKPDILLYFKTVQVSSLKDLKDAQLLKTYELKEKIDDNGSMVSEVFSAPNEFCEKVQDNLDTWINKSLQNR